MQYLKEIPPELRKNTFIRAQVSDMAVLRLIANLGFAEPAEVARVFSPYDTEWEETVRARHLAYLLYAQNPGSESGTTSRIKKLSHSDEANIKPFVEKIEKILGAMSATEKKDVASAVNRTPKIQRESKVSPFTGLPLKYSGVPLLGTAWEHYAQVLSHLNGFEKTGVSERLWQKTRALAVKKQDSSALILSQRRLIRLTNAKLLIQKTTGTNTKLYGLTQLGARYLGAEYSPSTGRSSLKSLHKTLAKGTLLSEVSRHVDGWSESAFYSSKHPGLLGTPGFLTHKELFGSRKDLKLHPPDGILLRPLRLYASEQPRVGIRSLTQKDLIGDVTKAAIGLTLIEAERGSKSADEFVRSLYPLINGNSALGHVTKSSKEVAQQGGSWRTLLELSSPVKKGPPATEAVFTPAKLIFALGSDEFLKTILAATKQFVSGYKVGAVKQKTRAETHKYSRTGMLNTLLDESLPEAAEAALWHELASFIEINFCATSISGGKFLGVSARFSLLEVANMLEAAEE